MVVVAASDLQFALEEVARAFEEGHPGVRLQLSFGSSGKWFTQLSRGLQADLFFSADAEFPRQLEQAGMVEPGTRRLYAVGRLVVWVRQDLLGQARTAARSQTAGAAAPAGVPPPAEPDIGPDLLRHPAVTRLAIANPVHAPYGRAALTLLEHYGLARRLRPVDWQHMEGSLDRYWDLQPLRAGKRSFEFVLGENVSQAAQLALQATGAGILALSVVRGSPLESAGRYWLAPLDSHLRLEQVYVVLRGRARPAVRAFYEFVASPQARAILRRYGFVLPGELPPSSPVAPGGEASL